MGPKVMRPGPKKPALAGPRLVIKNHIDSTNRARKAYGSTSTLEH